MKTVGIKCSFGCWPEPAVVVYTCRYRSIWFYRDALHPTLIRPCLHQPDFTPFTRMHKINSVLKMLLAPLPLPYLYDTIVFLRCSNHDFTFPYGIADRFFDVDVFTCLYGIHHVPTVPVIRRRNTDGIDAITFKQVSIIDTSFHLQRTFLPLGDAFIQSNLIYIPQSGTLYTGLTKQGIQTSPSHPVLT